MVTRDDMIEALAKQVPIGSKSADARKVMQTAGFECKLISAGSFSESPGLESDDRKYKSIENSDYLLCRRIDSSKSFKSNVWSVAIVVDAEEKVSDWLVRYFPDAT